MACLYPRSAYWTRDKEGVRGISFKPTGPSVISGTPIKVPCGQCIQCRLAHSRMWATRAMHEFRMCQMNPENDSSFITLTYDDKNLPEGGTLVRRDLQLFMKRLRKKKKQIGIRFYGCGEYGSQTNRPHYHVLLFNTGFPDKTYYAPSGSGEPLFVSRELEELWPFGHNRIGNVQFSSCSYVARYICDKITGDMAADHYMGRLPEFPAYSRNPGLGKTYFDKYGREAYLHDSVVIEGRELPLPRYYDIKYAELDAAELERIKVLRRRKAMLSRDRSEENNVRRRVKETFELRKAAVFARKAV